MEDGHSIGRTETPADVPQTKMEGDFPVEKASINWIENALNHRGFVAKEANSRENSLATTKLEEALMWAQKDLEVKEGIKALRDAEAPSTMSDDIVEDKDVEDEVG